MSDTQTEFVKNCIKSKAANYLVLKNTKNNLNMIKRAQRETAPACATGMKSKADQYYFMQNSAAFVTGPY